MILIPAHGVGLETAQGHSAGARRPARFTVQGRSGLACSVRLEADVAWLVRALTGAARTRGAVTARMVRVVAWLGAAHRWTESGAVFG
jgi:hypothetical protein